MLGDKIKQEQDLLPPQPELSVPPQESSATVAVLMLRSSLFLFAWALSTLPYSAALLVLWLGRASLDSRYRVAQAWGRASVWLARVICGIRYRVLHADGIPLATNPRHVPLVVLANHQSAWETIALISILPNTAFIVKQELLRIPFFGFGLWAINPIAIRRSKKIAALEQLETQGRACVAAKRLIVVFPEGTRTPMGVSRPYQRGGVHLANRLGVPVQLLAHNAGAYWGRRWWQKRGGEITLSIGPRLVAAGDVFGLSRAWIESEKKRLSVKGQRFPTA